VDRYGPSSEAIAERADILTIGNLNGWLIIRAGLSEEIILLGIKWP